MLRFTNPGTGHSVQLQAPREAPTLDLSDFLPTQRTLIEDITHVPSNPDCKTEPSFALKHFHEGRNRFREIGAPYVRSVAVGDPPKRFAIDHVDEFRHRVLDHDLPRL